MTSANLEDLREGQRLHSVDLTRSEAAALNRSGLVTALPDLDGWTVTAEHAVGAVRRGDLLVRVTPKVGAAQVLALLARAHGVRGLKIDPERVDVAPDADLSAVLAVLFTQEAAAVLAAGPLRGYRSEDQSLPVLRGRVRLREQHLRRFGLPIPLEVTVDEWTLDTDDNRRLRAAGVLLLGLAGVPASATRTLQRLDRSLSEVQLPVPGAPVAPWAPTRLNARFHRLLHLADVVLAHASVEHQEGSTQTHGFVINMAWLFETFVARLLHEQLPAWHSQATLPLDTKSRATIRPDLILNGAAGVMAVADTKYKLIDDTSRIPNADIYQLVTYCARLGLDTGHLLYVAGGVPVDDLEVIGTDVRLVVHVVDLTRGVEEIEAQVAAIGREISRGAQRPRDVLVGSCGHCGRVDRAGGGAGGH